MNKFSSTSYIPNPPTLTTRTLNYDQSMGLNLLFSAPLMSDLEYLDLSPSDCNQLPAMGSDFLLSGCQSFILDQLVLLVFIFVYVMSNV